MAYTLEDLDDAIANSIGPAAWAAVGAGTSGFSRVMVMNKAAIERWFRKMPEDEDARVLREAYADLGKDGCLRPSDGWGDDEQGGKEAWE